MRHFLSIAFFLFIGENVHAQAHPGELSASLQLAWIGAAAIIAAIATLLFALYRNTTKLNQQLMKRERELQELNAMNDKLFSIMGHDLRSPIAMIPSILFLYEEEDDAVLKGKLLTDLKQQADMSLETLDKLLYWRQSMLKGKGAEVQTFAAKQYTTGNAELRKLDAEAKNITITDRVAKDIYVKTNPTHFDFIVRNLLANAIKYSDKNSHVEMYADTKMRPGYVVIAVQDNGIGMDERTVRSVFQPAHSTPGTAGEHGTGIGLMVCKDLAEKGGGDLWVESKPGSGSTFYLAVPSTA